MLGPVGARGNPSGRDVTVAGCLRVSAGVPVLTQLLLDPDPPFANRA